MPSNKAFWSGGKCTSASVLLELDNADVIIEQYSALAYLALVLVSSILVQQWHCRTCNLSVFFRFIHG